MSASSAQFAEVMKAGLDASEAAVGNAVGDSSGHGNNGTLVGGAKWVQGRFGYALSFDGVNSGLHVFDNSSLERLVVGRRACPKAVGGEKAV